MTALHSSEFLEGLIAQLSSADIKIRVRARQDLVQVGKPAVTHLVEALKHPSDYVRWEAARSLHEIADAHAAPALVESMKDARQEVRWAAAEALVALGTAALAPLVRRLETDFASVHMREGAFHVLHELHHQGLLNDELKLVLQLLQRVEPEIELPIVAHRAHLALHMLHQ
jgi:hypothetical protein